MFSFRSRAVRLIACVVLATQLVNPQAVSAAAGPPSNTRIPKISDTTPTDGNTLTAYPGGWLGTNPVSFSYRWLRCDSGCSAIPGADAKTYAVSAADVGLRLRVRVTATNVDDSKTVRSKRTAAVRARRPSNDEIPTIAGQPTVAKKLTAAPGTWSGTPSISYTYRWKRCDSSGDHCNSIRDAKSRSYRVQHADAGATIRVAVTASNGGGSKSAWSNSTAVVEVIAPTNTTRPTVDGTGRARLALRANAGSWTGTAPIVSNFRGLLEITDRNTGRRC